jgi:ATP-binding cassette subfamily B protein
MSNNTNKKTSFAAAFKNNLRAWKILFKPCKGIFVSIFLSALTAAASPLVTIWFSAQLLNELAGSRNPAALRNWVLLTLGATAGIMLLNAILQHWREAEESTFYAKMQSVFGKKRLDMDFPNADSQRVYELQSQIWQSQNFTGYGLRQSIEIFRSGCNALFQIIGGIGLSLGLFFAKIPQASGLGFLNSPLFTIGFIALLFAAALAAPVCATKGNSYWERNDEQGTFGNRVFGYFSSASSNRARMADMRFYKQQAIAENYLEKNNTFSMKSTFAQYAKGPMGLLIALSSCVSAFLTGLIYLLVCIKAWAGAFGLGTATQYIGSVTSFFGGFSELMKCIGVMRINSSFLDTVFELLDTPNTMYQGSLTTEKRSDIQYDVEFRDVSFKYPGSEAYALRHVNMKFKVGSRLAVVGMNGSGKTTFIKLLCRLYDPTEGEILLNGINIRKYRYDDYMKIFSVVFQDFQLLALPLGQNVAASQTYDAARVLDCLNKAGFGEKLAKMPHGLDTYLYKSVDTEGVDVSGGEAQKIAIARALYKDSPFIILDEPTAALDPIAEAEIYSKFDEIAGDKTAVYISHRLSSCKFCDEIAVFDSGSVIQQGTHSDLLADESGKYFELWNAQAQYYKKDTVQPA